LDQVRGWQTAAAAIAEEDFAHRAEMAASADRMRTKKANTLKTEEEWWREESETREHADLLVAAGKESAALGVRLRGNARMWEQRRRRLESEVAERSDAIGRHRARQVEATCRVNFLVLE
jgi:hypothetical protein